MHRIPLVLALATALAVTARPVAAIQIPGSGPVELLQVLAIVDMEIAILLPAIQKERQARANGFVRLGARQVVDTFHPEETLTPGGRAAIFSADVLDFNLALSFPTDGDTGSATVQLTPETGFVEVLERGWFTDGDSTFIDASGLPPGTPIMQFAVDKFGPGVGFPDGRRLGDDTEDLLLLQLFKGSVNLGVVALPEGFAGPPGVLGSGQLSAGDVFAFGAVLPVPLPPSALLLVPGLGALLMPRRGRRGTLGKGRVFFAALCDRKGPA